MAEQELEIIISPDGKVTVETHGLKGEDCLKYAEMLVELLGRQESLEKTVEYYQNAQKQREQAQVKQRL